jgi:cyclase
MAGMRAKFPILLLIAAIGNLLLTATVLAGGAHQASPSHSHLPFTLRQVGPGVWAAVDDAAGDSGANAGFVIGEDGVAVIDTFERPEAARRLLEEIRARTALPIRFVVNTHYHLDHVAGNTLFAEQGATIVAQRNVRAWMRTENLKFFGPSPKPEQKKMVESLTLPDVTYTGSIELYLGSRRLVVREFPGHTGGDSAVIVPDAHVIFCGDLFWNHTLPNLIDASTGPWLETLSNLETLDPAATFVAGHGDIGKVGDVREFQDYLFFLRRAVGKALQAGGPENAEAAVYPQLEAKYGNWGFFKYFAKRDITDTAAEMRGTKRVPVPAK